MGKIFIFVLFILFNISCYAFTLNGSVTGESVRFSNAINKGDDKYTLADWEPQSNLIPTLEWSPGFQNPGQKLTLNGESGSVNVDVEVIGIEYNMGSALSTSSTPGIISGTTCNIDDFNGGSIIHLELVDGPSECISNYKFTNKVSVMPFYFLRPILKINLKSIAESFQNMDDDVKKEGWFVGTVSFPLRYWYLSMGGVVTYRNIPFSFTMKLFYRPSTLTKMTITNKASADYGVLIPKLDSGGNSISASTTFEIQADGFFVSGLVMELSDSKYYLTMDHNANNADYEIPFSLTCDACNDRILVKEGERQLKYTSITTGNTKQINFEFQVHYDGIMKENVRIGNYSGSFTVLFGADI